MNEMNEFDDIGKRLYELEAEPPKDGWHRIAGAVRAGDSGKVVMIKRWWWISLILVVPAALYLVGEKIQPQTMTATLSDVVNKENSIADTGDEAGNTKSNPIVVQSATASDLTLKKNEQISSNANEVSGLKKVAGDNVPQEKSELQSYALDSQQQEVEFSEVGSVEGIGDSPALTGALLADSNTAADSVVTPVENLKDVVIPNADQQEDDEEKKTMNRWRWSVAFTPQYIQPTVSPDKYDEVFVTSVSDKNSSLAKRIGYGFAIGVGRQLNDQWYVDGQLTYSQTDQTIYYQYATGKIDTLVAVLMADQSVSVTPVYEQKTRETAASYKFLGFKLSSTYYFWATERGRFNFTTGVGINVLTAASVRQREETGWSDLSNDGLNRLNYSLSVGAGYSINLGRSWEVMVNPTLTQHLRQMKNQQLPYNINQRSVGLNLMVLKSF